MNPDIRKTAHSSLKLSDVHTNVHRRSDVSIDLEFFQKNDDVFIDKVQLMLLGNYHSQHDQQEAPA